MSKEAKTAVTDFMSSMKDLPLASIEPLIMSIQDQAVAIMNMRNLIGYDQTIKFLRLSADMLEIDSNKIKREIN